MRSTVLCLTIASAISACQSSGGPSAPPPTTEMIRVTMNPGSWYFQASPGMPLNPMAHPEGGWSFNFPPRDGAHGVIHTVIGSAPKEIRITGRVEGAGPLVAVDGCAPPRVRIFLQKRGDNYTLPSSEANQSLNLTSPSARENWRWWNEGSILEPGASFDVIAPLQPDKWSQVWGRSGATRVAAFTDAISNLQAVGVSLGACSAMHGVYANGPARFVLKEFSVR